MPKNRKDKDYKLKYTKYFFAKIFDKDYLLYIIFY